MAGFTLAGTRGGRGTHGSKSRSRSFTRSRSTCRSRTRCAAACRTTIHGAAPVRRRTFAASPTRIGPQLRGGEARLAGGRLNHRVARADGDGGGCDVAMDGLIGTRRRRAEVLALQTKEPQLAVERAGPLAAATV